MPADSPKNTAPLKDATSPLTDDPEALFESALLELFDHHDLPPERIAWLCLHWADQIFAKLGQDAAENLPRSREFMNEVNAMTSSSMQVVNDPESGPSMRTTACIGQRQLMGFGRWARLDEHVATQKIEPYRGPAGAPKDD